MSERNYWTKLGRRTMSRRTLLRASARAGVGAAGLALVGCGDDDDDDQPAVAQVQQQQQAMQQEQAEQQAEQQAVQEEQQQQTAAEQQQQAQEQTVAAAGHVPTGEIRTPVTLFSGTESATGTSGTDHQMLWTIYDNLVSYDKDSIPQPARSLAQSWEIPDELSVVFNLRENVQFHDGTPLSAEAVRLWVERGKTLDVSTIAGDLAAVGNVEESDDLTATFQMDRPFSPLLWILGDRAGMIASPAVYDDFTEANSRSEPVGAGAFRFVEEELDSPFIVEANPNYWQPNAPSVERITWFQGTSQTTGNVNGLLAGDYDIVSEVSIEDHGRIEDAGFNLQLAKTNTVLFYNLNTNLGPWGNEHARHAFNAGFDRTELNDVAYGGYHTPALWGWFGPAVIYHDPDERFWEFDPERVRMHLAAGGLEDGFEFDMVVKADDPLYVDPALFAQAQLAQFGITMNVVQKPHPDFWAGFYAETDPAFAGGMSMRGDIWQQLFWNLGAGGPHDHILPPGGDAEMEAALIKVTETFELEPRIEAMQEANRIAESRSYQVKTTYSTTAVATDPSLEYTFFQDAKKHFGQNDVRWVT